MKVVAINGSPRKNGNTRILLEAVLEPLKAAGWDTELVQLGARKIHGCRACFKCFEKKDHRCAFDDDVLNEVLEKVLAADALVLGSPTYFADITPEIKAFMDRAGLVSMANGCLLAGKIGAAVVAVRRGGATHVFDSMNHLFQISQMIVPGSTYWNMAYGLGEGEVKGDAEGLRNMGQLGRAIDWLGRAVQALGQPYPVLAGAEEI